MRRSTFTTLFFSALLLTLWSCGKKETQITTASPSLPATPYDYSNSYKDAKIAVISWEPGHVSLTNINVNIIAPSSSNYGITLGRVIFNDRIVSIKASCSSCHVTPPNLPAIANENSERLPGNANTTMITVHNNGSYRQDMSISGSQGAAIHPATGMEDAAALVARMAATSYYPKLFKDAYGSEEITTGRISDALEQYMSAMATANSSTSFATDPRFADPFK